MSTCSALLLALGVALANRPLVSDPRRPRRAWLLVGLVLLFALRWVASDRPVAERAVVSLACCAIIPPKLLDAYLAPNVWCGRRWAEWARYLVNPFVLCYRRHLLDAGRPGRESIPFVIRGAAEMALGQALMRWAYGIDWTVHPFLWEHLMKVAAAYLLVFDGAFVFANGTLGMLGGRYMDFCRHPILASTPADFWRRYNRDAGRFLHENVYPRLHTGRRKLGLFLVFAVSGVLHEYLAVAILHRLTGLQILSFSLHGLATVATSGVRPRGWRRFAWTIGTLAFNVVTSMLFLEGAGFYALRTV